MVGAAGPGWTEREVVEALDILETARASWKRHFDSEIARQRELKRRDPNARRLSQGELFVRWCETYFVGEQADLWLVAGLGDCERCGHLLIHHGSHACAACGIDPNVPWDQRCGVSLPDPQPGRRASTRSVAWPSSRWQNRSRKRA